MILGYIGAPIVWMVGVCQADMFLVGLLLGEKTVLNESNLLEESSETIQQKQSKESNYSAAAAE